MFLKLDFPKPLIRSRGPFSWKLLSHLGFSPVWRNMISSLLRMASTHVLVNGQPGDVLRHQRGLWQGHPLSPMLFILVMDVLNSMFTEACALGLLQPLSWTMLLFLFDR